MNDNDATLELAYFAPFHRPPGRATQHTPPPRVMVAGTSGLLEQHAQDPAEYTYQQKFPENTIGDHIIFRLEL